MVAEGEAEDGQGALPGGGLVEGRRQTGGGEPRDPPRRGKREREGGERAGGGEERERGEGGRERGREQQRQREDEKLQKQVYTPSPPPTLKSAPR